jgi:signal transduction histidine kinase
VFEPFYTTKRDGTGLGLSLTQQIASEHGGGVTVTSRPPDGTTILLTLPALASDALPVTENMQAQQ